MSDPVVINVYLPKGEQRNCETIEGKFSRRCKGAYSIHSLYFI